MALLRVKICPKMRIKVRMVSLPKRESTTKKRVPIEQFRLTSKQREHPIPLFHPALPLFEDNLYQICSCSPTILRLL
jgi:hypothetical protein